MATAFFGQGSLHSSRSKALDCASLVLGIIRWLSDRYQSLTLSVNVQDHLRKKNLLPFFRVIYLRAIPTARHSKFCASDFS
jgi:hypothetical protein